MGPTLKERSKGKRSRTDVPSNVPQWLPAAMRVLHITTRNRTGGWLAEAFAADSASQVS